MKISQTDFDITLKTIRKLLKRKLPKFERCSLIDASRVIRAQTLDPKLEEMVKRAMKRL